MSINWVMLPPPGTNEPFVKLPNERILYTSPPRTSLALKTPNSFPGRDPFSAYSSAGTAYITNQRLVYLPKDRKPNLESFSAPILNLQDTCVRSPMFGANYWNALVKPVPGGNIPSTQPYLELKMVFSEGGAFDYHNIFEQIKERAAHALEIARETQGSDVDMANVHLEQLPAYEPSGVSGGETLDGPTDARDSGISMRTPSPAPRPSEPPPAYEEAQVNAVIIDLDARLRAEAEHSSEN